MSQDEPDTDTVERLDRFWEQLLAGNAPDDERLDPVLATTVRQLHARHQPPVIDPLFQRRLAADLMPPAAATKHHPARHAAESPNGVENLNGRMPPAVRLQTQPAPRHPRFAPASMVLRIAAAIVLLVVVASAAGALLYPLRQRAVGSGALVAGSEPPAAEAQGPEATTLLDLSLTDLPTDRYQLGMEIGTIPPGSISEQRSGTGPQLFYVAEGPLTVRANTAPEPLWIIPPGSTGQQASDERIAQGQHATLQTGHTLLAPAGAEVDLYTTESAPAQVVWLLGATNNTYHNDVGISWSQATNGFSTHALTAPVAIVLRKASLPPDVTFPAPASTETHQVAALLDSTRLGELRTGTGGAIRNAGEQPLDLYVLTVATRDAAAARDEPG